MPKIALDIQKLYSIKSWVLFNPISLFLCIKISLMYLPFYHLYLMFCLVQLSLDLRTLSNLHIEQFFLSCEVFFLYCLPVYVHHVLYYLFTCICPSYVVLSVYLDMSIICCTICLPVYVHHMLYYLFTCICPPCVVLSVYLYMSIICCTICLP